MKIIIAIFLEKGLYVDKSNTYYFKRVFVKGIDIKTSESKECDICHYCYFLDKGFKFQLNVCNECHDLLMMSMNLSILLF